MSNADQLINDLLTDYQIIDNLIIYWLIHYQFPYWL